MDPPPRARCSKRRAPKRGGASTGGPDTPGTPKVKTQAGFDSGRRRKLPEVRKAEGTWLSRATWPSWVARLGRS